ncbi:MAG: bifunctional diaminohydroxyphosphoribosylaminopyrimidine deaminase/5-amino-6-(5-phosphoribosylamino)uracil reductase RibD [Planctomycetes bacterium]|nr:bifunctional diaminohydroxyphosphoribosylaminopyrimidine deaminase/5-amino-6-(5-phosphoribosylamino)uracil reductase RibD [Planctomycetota bacterium]
MTQTTTVTLNETQLRSLLAELADGARAFRFEVAPNPCVGAALVAGGQVVARGYHRVWGGPHAEVEVFAAARAAGVQPSECDALVVTLEPCCSFGKTPPCTDAIRAAGIRRVVVGALDPDPRHRGAGLKLLAEAGLEIEFVPNASPLEKLAPHFLRWSDIDRVRRPRPWAIAKWAQTRSGHLSPPAGVGDGRWISGPEALREVHVLRGRVDAIVTGVTTVLKDNPRFTVRPPGDPARPPLRVILDSYLRTPTDGRLFEPPGAGEGAGAIHVLCQAGANAARHVALERAGATVTGLRSSEEDHVALRDVQEWLWDHGVRRVLLEAGPQLLSRSLEAGFVDQLRVYTGNVAGGEGETMAPWFTRLKLEERLDREIGGDSVFESFVRNEA